jgi:pyruvate-formate lyase-activating enzyme
LAIASLYFMARAEAGHGAAQPAGAMLPFLDKVRMELKHAAPEAYQSLKAVQGPPEWSGAKR